MMSMRESHQLLASETYRAQKTIERDRVMTRPSPIVWLNLVCLDAPIVAITWQWLFGRSFHLSISMPTRVALFLTAWLIYLADRLADTWSLRINEPRSLRQQFCQRYQTRWFGAIVVLAIIDLWIISRHLDRAIIHVGILLGTFSLAYLAVNYWLGKIWRVVPAKELCVGSLFAIGTVASLLPKNDFSAEFPGSFLLFAALCSLNCISIAIWERDLDLAQRKNSIATRWNNVQVWSRVCVIALTMIAIVMALTTKPFTQLYWCICVSALLLGALDWVGDKIQRDERTALADLVLLMPALLFSAAMAG